MKKIWSVILCVILLLSIIPHTAILAATSSADFLYWINEDEGYVNIYGYNGNSTSVVFPDTIQDYPVTELGDGMYFEWGYMATSSVKSITIPASITRINGGEELGLCYLNSLENIVVDSNNSVYDSRNSCNAIIETKTNTLISGCKNTTIPEGVVSIAYGALDLCKGLEKVAIPSSVTTIDSLFSGCDNLKEITVDKNNKTFDSRNNCNAIIESKSNTLKLGISTTVIPDTVKAIGFGAFANKHINSMSIPESVNHILDGGFAYCTGIKEIVLPESLKTIGENVFGGCADLTKITFLSKDCTIPDSPYALPDYAGGGMVASVEEYSEPQRVTYYGHEGSTIQEHCKKYNLLFEPLKTSDDDNTEDPVNPDRVFGDTDGDGDVSVLDATAIQLHLASLKIMDSTALSVADTDKDGDVSILDATQIQLYLSKLIPDLQ